MKNSYSIEELEQHFPKLIGILSGDTTNDSTGRDFLTQAAEAYSALHYGSLVFSLAVMPALEKVYGKRKVAKMSSEQMFFEVARAIERGDIDEQSLRRSIAATAKRFASTDKQ